MIYFCADDYGIGESCNERIEDCLKNGILNKISVLPNGMTEGFREKFSGHEAVFSLHLNLVEGYPLSAKEEIPHLLSEDGSFRDSFIRLFLRTISLEGREIREEIYREIRKQLAFWKKEMGEDAPLSIDSHQHTHMIPAVFRALNKVLFDEEIKITYMRIPAEPIMPYIKTPSLYFTYKPINIIKQWLLKLLWTLNMREAKKYKIPTSYFCGILFSGKMDEKRVSKILPKYKELAKKDGKDIEVLFHPGFMDVDKEDINHKNIVFKEFYLSKNRKTEFDSVIKISERSVQ